MAELIKLVKTYRLTPALDQRQRLAEEIFTQLEPPLRFFVFGTLTHPAAQDVLQETLKAVTVSLPNSRAMQKNSCGRGATASPATR